jgi:Flp pilus assembly protein TadG
MREGTLGRGRRGASSAELAIVLPVLTTLAIGCVDFGRFAYHYIAIHGAARTGAEYGTTTPYTTQSLPTWTTKVQEAAAAELDGQTGFDPAALTTTVTPATDGATGRQVRVEVQYTGFKTLVSWPAVPSQPTMRAAVVMRMIR